MQEVNHARSGSVHLLTGVQWGLLVELDHDVSLPISTEARKGCGPLCALERNGSVTDARVKWRKWRTSSASCERGTGVCVDSRVHWSVKKPHGLETVKHVVRGL